MLSGLAFDTRALYDAFRKSGGDRPGHSGAAPIVDDGLGLALHRAPFESRAAGALLEADRGIAENLAFDVPVVAPSHGPPGERLVVLLHGLNETLWNKLIPWAASLARVLRAPVALFPMALHVTRRPHGWIDLGRSLHGARAALPDNAFASPFNAVLSERLEAAPERFLRAGAQTLADLGALAEAAARGALPGCREGARVDLVGYSAGGYAALARLTSDDDGEGHRFARSRVVLVAAGADLEGLRTESLFILDARASRALRDTLGGEPAATHALAQRFEGVRAFLEVCAGRGAVLVSRLGERASALAFEGDRVIPAARIGANLGPQRVTTLDAGVHEYPFSMAGPVPGTWSPRIGRALLGEVARASEIAAPLRPSFERFVEAAVEHLES